MAQMEFQSLGCVGFSVQITVNTLRGFGFRNFSLECLGLRDSRSTVWWSTNLGGGVGPFHGVLLVRLTIDWCVYCGPQGMENEILQP